MANKIKQSNVLSLESKVFGKRTITIQTEGETFEVTINEKLKQTEVSQIVVDLVKQSEQAKDNKTDFNLMANIMIIFLKKFTDIQFKKETGDFLKDYESDVKMLNALINLGILSQIMNEFGQEEFDKIAQTFVKSKDDLKLIGNNITAEHFLNQSESEQDGVQ